MKKAFLSVLFLFVIFIPCFAQVDVLKKAVCNGKTLEEGANILAGRNGEYFFYEPAFSYKNKNFKPLAVKIENPDFGEMEAVYCVDTVANTTLQADQVTINGKTFTYDQYGLPSDEDAYAEVFAWVFAITLTNGGM